MASSLALHLMTNALSLRIHRSIIGMSLKVIKYPEKLLWLVPFLTCIFDPRASAPAELFRVPFPDF